MFHYFDMNVFLGYVKKTRIVAHLGQPSHLGRALVHCTSAGAPAALRVARLGKTLDRQKDMVCLGDVEAAAGEHARRDTVDFSCVLLRQLRARIPIDAGMRAVDTYRLIL